MLPDSICPKCQRNDMVQKVSAIYHGGFSEVVTSGPTAGMGMSGGKFVPVVGYGTQRGYSQTSLSQRLAPPARPSNISGIWYIMPFLFNLILPFAPVKDKRYVVPLVVMYLSFCGMGNQNAGQAVLFLFVMLGALVASLIMYYQSLSKGRALSAQEEGVWSKEIDEWNRLYYCFRDDYIFVPL